MATRFYLPVGIAAPISPTYHASWTSTSIAQRAAMFPFKSGTTLQTVTRNITPGNGINCFQQYVSPPLAAQTLSAQAVQIWVSGVAHTALDAQLYWTVRVFAPDGTTVRGTVVSHQSAPGDYDDDGTTFEARGESVTSSSVSVQEGDYLVLEIGVDNDPSTGNFSFKLGDNNANDLGGSSGEVNIYNPWLQFANDVLFQGGHGDRQTVLSNGYGPIVGV